MNTAGLVSIRQGTEQNVIVTVDDNIMDYLIVRVQDDELIIEVINNVTLSNYELAIDVSMTDLESLVTNSAGSIRGLNTFEEDRVNLMVNSAGSAEVFASELLDVTINSVGSVFYKGDPVIIQHLNSIGRVYSAN